MYDVFTILAENVSFERNKSLLIIKGNVFVDDGKQQDHVECVEIELKEDKPVINIVPRGSSCPFCSGA
jgi:hypothetical protein